MEGSKRVRGCRKDRDSGTKRRRIESMVKEKKEAIRTQGKARNLRLSVLNVNGFTDVSIKETKDYLASRRPDLMGLVETKLREEQMNDSEWEMSGYERYEARRSDLEGDTKGGGIMIYARTKEGLEINEYRMPKLPMRRRFVDKERKWVVVKTDEYDTAVCVMYLSHQASDDRFGEHNEIILEVLRAEIGVLRAKGNRIVLMGDMNAWVGSELGVGVPGGDPRTNANGLRFLQFLKDVKLVHLNGATRSPMDWSTRMSKGTFTRHDSMSATTLDFICVSKEHQRSIKSLVVDEEGKWGGGSDHVFLESNFEDSFVVKSCKFKKKKKSKPKWDFNEESDWSCFGKILDETLEVMSVREENNIDGLGKKLADCLETSLRAAFGEKKPGCKLGKRFPHAVLVEMRKKRVAKSEWRISRSALSRDRGNVGLRVETAGRLDKLNVQTEVLEEKMRGFWGRRRGQVLKELSEKTVAASRKFWSYFRGISKSPAGFSVVEDPSTGELEDDEQEVVRVVQEFLVKLFEGSLEKMGREVEQEDLLAPNLVEGE